MQVDAKPDEQWLRNQISGYFESEHELTLDGKLLSAAFHRVRMLLTDNGDCRACRIKD